MLRMYVHVYKTPKSDGTLKSDGLKAETLLFVGDR